MRKLLQKLFATSSAARPHLLYSEVMFKSYDNTFVEVRLCRMK